ncbi:unnamed protein product [Linum trigynum]|uniref:Secreted protein n=1 Tax=Linum trigynum TaxID=586398 RepID=A0AAV2CDD0_9ROSI
MCFASLSWRGMQSDTHSPFCCLCYCVVVYPSSAPFLATTKTWALQIEMLMMTKFPAYQVEITKLSIPTNKTKSTINIPIQSVQITL